ncbi:MAG: murein biosynthesis integral membrane protein MurJ [Chloroflexota bacterium]|nr:MAG: murein biosynthesis integral membrane protein MurJ [Chloroflexota bacterium]
MASRTKAIVSATAILMVAFVASRVLGLARDIVIAHAFGTSAELDAYNAAFRLPDFVFQLVAGGAFASAIIPVFSTYATRRGPEEAWRIVSAVANAVVLGALLIALAALVLAPRLVPWLVPEFSPAHQSLVVNLTRVMLISPVAFSVSIVVTSVLNARQHFLWPAIAPIVYNLSTITGALLATTGLGIYGLAAGVAAGSVLHLAVQLPALSRCGARYNLTLDLGHPGVREVLRLLLPRTIGLTAAQISLVVYTALASGLASGSIASLNYAWLLTMMPLGIFGIAVANAVFPTLAEQVAEHDLDSLRRTVHGALRMVLFLTIPASVGLITLRVPLIALLFQRGSFDQQSTQMTAWALLFFAAGLFAHATLEVVTRAFYALHDTLTPVTLAVVSMILNVGLSFVLVRFLQHGGLALSMSIATMVEASFLLVILSRRVPQLVDWRLAAACGKVLTAAGVMGGVIGVLGSRGFIEQTSEMTQLVAVVAAAMLGGFVYLGIALVLRSDEIGAALRALANIRKKI